MKTAQHPVPDTRFARFGLALAALLASASSLQAVAAPQALPREKTHGVASYVSGGVSQEEARRFELAARDYPLVLKLYEQARPRDEFTAGAHVVVEDAHGRAVVDDRADGPYMLVRLPAGRYALKASLDGHALPVRQVQVTDHGHTQSVFVFPAEPGRG